MRQYGKDYHYVGPEHRAVHDRLINWARWVTPSTPSQVSPMFRQYRAPWWQWHTPQHRETVDLLDAEHVERQMRHLHDKVRVAGVWSYVYPYIPPGRVCQHLGMTHKDLQDHVCSFRDNVQARLELVTG